MNRKNGCNSSVRIGNIPAAATIGGGCSAKNKHTASIMCLVALSSLTAAFAFCPGEFGRAGRSVDLSSIRMHGGLSKICRQSRRLPSALFSSDDDEVNDAISRINKEETTEALPVGDESLEDEDEEIEDIVLQKLHRSAQRGPINPMKEHDKMLQENEDEFLNVTSSGDADTEGEEELHKSTFYRQLVASYIDPYMDVHGSQDETYVDEQMYEMLSRDGEVLEKFGPGLSTMPLDPTSEEGKVEDDLAQKERSLQNIVKQIDAGEGKWDKAKIDEAARLKDQIDKMHIDDFGNVLLANLAFYEAFSARDADWMKDVWWQSPSTICVHPSHEPLVGSKAVLENFRQMFDREMMSREKSRDRIVDTLPAPSVFMSPANIRGLSVRGTTASLVCDEEVIDRDSYSNGRVVVNKLLATNVFRKIGGKWKMVHRHASWHPETLAADAAIKAKPGFAPVKTKRAKFSDSLEEKRMRIKKLGGGGSTSIRPQDAQPSPRSLDGLNANNAVGIPDVKMPKKKKKKPSEEENLLRMLGISAGSNDDVDDDDDNDDDQDESSSNPRTKKFSLSDLLRSAGDGKTTRTGSGTPEDPFITRRVITIGPEEFNKLAAEGDKINEEGDEDSDEDDEDSDDDDENSVVIDLRDKTEEERKKILKEIFPNQVESLLNTIRERENERDAEGKLGETRAMSVDASIEAVDNVKKLKSAAEFLPSPIIIPKETKQSKSETQRCIDAIRQLSDEGQLSPKQKRVLLTDIIASSARGETSMVEVAYGLLLGDDSEPGMEDFTEQCRVFAASSMDANEF